MSILQTPSRIFNCLGKVVSSTKLIVLLLCNTGSVITLSISLNLFKVVEDGYEFFAKRQLVTLFSAPNYCGEFDNAGGMMSVDETLMCSFQVTILFPFHELKCFKLVFIHSLQILKPSEKKAKYQYQGLNQARPVTPRGPTGVPGMKRK